MKKLVLALSLVVGGLGIASCTTSDVSANVAAIGGETNIYAFQAVSTAELLTEMSSSTLSLNKTIEEDDSSIVKLGHNYSEDEEDTEDEPIVTAEIDSIDTYLTMIDKFVGVDNALTVTFETSDNPEYAQKCTYVATDISGERATYVLYYNEVLYVDEDATPIDSTLEESSSIESSDEESTSTESSSIESSEEDSIVEDSSTTSGEVLGLRGHGEREHEFVEDSEDEIKYLLTGILTVGELTYSVEGKKVIEDDEEVLKMYSYIDHDNFVKVSYKTEDTEKKFNYEMVSAGTLVSKTSVKVDTEDGKVKITLKFVEGDAKGEYRFTTEVIENVTNIRVKYEVEDADGNEETGNIKITGTYDLTTDTTTYTYEVLADGRSKTHGYSEEHHGNHGKKSTKSINEDANTIIA